MSKKAALYHNSQRKSRHLPSPLDKRDCISEENAGNRKVFLLYTVKTVLLILVFLTHILRLNVYL